MSKKVLITGSKGFLGSNIAKHFKNLGYKTYGIGHGGLSVDESKEIGLDYWKKDDVSIKSILEFEQTFDAIVHCGGSGSVGFSIEHPYEDFKKTVDGTLEILEYMRVYNLNAHLIYPSSPAVQGEHPDTPIQEDYIGKPSSPYGYHKKIAEDLCQSYSEKYNLKVSVIRLFSVYGNGLKKQLLWDACHKIKNSDSQVIFWGTGAETRDFVHIDDVFLLVDVLLKQDEKFILINGGSGIKFSIKYVVEMIRDLMNPLVGIIFNNQANIGNPIYYWADTQKLQKYGFKANRNLEQEIKSYVEWVKVLDD